MKTTTVTDWGSGSFFSVYEHQHPKGYTYWNVLLAEKGQKLRRIRIDSNSGHAIGYAWMKRVSQSF